MWTEAAVAAACVVAMASGAFVAVERRTRARWRGATVVEHKPRTPYRETNTSVRIGERAPPLVQVGSFAGILVGSIAGPAATYALVELPSDGIALSLLPAIGVAAANFGTGWMLLVRSRWAVDAARLTALATRMTSVALLALAGAHVVAARAGWSDRESLAYVVVACALALAMWPQAVFSTFLLRRFEGQLSTNHRTTIAPVRFAASAPLDEASFAPDGVDHAFVERRRGPGH